MLGVMNATPALNTSTADAVRQSDVRMWTHEGNPWAVEHGATASYCQELLPAGATAS
jgi:hypothetical protein